MGYAFVYEASNHYKIKVAIGLLLFLALFLGLTIIIYTVATSYSSEHSFLASFVLTIQNEIINLTPIGLFYSSFLGGIFIVPSAEEIVFYLALMKGNPIILSIVLVNLGHYASQVVNYFLGLKIGKLIVPLISKRKIYKARRFVNKYGQYGVFIFNVTPLPAPLLTFALGITRYNKYRLFLFTIAGTILKYAVIAGVFVLVH